MPAQIPCFWAMALLSLSAINLVPVTRVKDEKTLEGAFFTYSSVSFQKEC